MAEETKYTIGTGNMVVDIISKLRQSGDSLSVRERAVASFVQANLNHISSMTVSELAFNLAPAFSKPSKVGLCPKKAAVCSAVSPSLSLKPSQKRRKDTLQRERQGLKIFA